MIGQIDINLKLALIIRGGEGVYCDVNVIRYSFQIATRVAKH